MHRREGVKHLNYYNKILYSQNKLWLTLILIFISFNTSKIFLLDKKYTSVKNSNDVFDQYLFIVYKNKRLKYDSAK